MSVLYEKSLLKLELDKVLEMLAERAGSYAGKERCMQLRPTSDLEAVQALLDQTSAACDLSTRKGYPGFSEIRDVKDSLDRADRGGALSPKELLRIAGVLRCARTVKAYTAEDEAPTVLHRIMVLPYTVTATPPRSCVIRCCDIPYRYIPTTYTTPSR